MSAKPLFHNLRQSFSVGKNAVPAALPQLAPVNLPLANTQSQIVDKLYAPASPLELSKLAADVQKKGKAQLLKVKPAEPKPKIAETPPQLQEEEFSTDYLNKILGEDPPAPNSLAAAVPTAVAQAADQSLNPSQPTGGTVKEIVTAPAPIEAPQVDVSPGVQYVETEPVVEMSPEVEEFLTRVESHHDQLPQEVVIADQQDLNGMVRPMAQPVVILPITSETEKAGVRKKPTFSIRWLVEWSRKMMKMFAGRIVYRAAS